MSAESTKPLRVFLSLPLPEEVRAAIHRFQKALSLPCDLVRWTPPDQLHITLKFFGTLPAREVSAIESATEAACAGAGPITLAAEGFGAFPSIRNPGILWIGLTGELERLDELRQAVRGATADFGNARQETGSFRPHITIGRARRENAARREMARLLTESTHVSAGRWTASEVQLMQSELSSDSSRYSLLCSVPLVAPPPLPRSQGSS